MGILDELLENAAKPIDAVENKEAKEEVTEDECVKEYADFIDENLFNSFLSEESDELLADINKLRLSDSISYQEISDIVVKMEAAENISDVTRLTVLESLTDLFEEWVNAEGEVVDNTLLEYAGNAEKNKILRQLMVEMEKCFTQYYGEIDFVVSSLDKCLDIVEAEAKKKNPDAKSAGLKIKAVYDKVDNELSKQENKDFIKNYNATWTKIKKICNSFSIKFNDVVMEDKKAFDKKLDAAAKKVTGNKKFTAWLPTANVGTENIKRFNKALDTLGFDNKDSVRSIVQFLQPIYGYGYQCMMGYIGNINFLRRRLAIEKEDTTFYKVLNKVIKTK